MAGEGLPTTRWCALRPSTSILYLVQTPGCKSDCTQRADCLAECAQIAGSPDGFEPPFTHRQNRIHAAYHHCQLPGQFSVDAAYVGTKGTRLQSSRGINVPREGPGPVQARRPFPDFGVITWNDQSASSIYHSLQLKLERRFYKGLSLLTAFTWSKSIDQDSTNGEGLYDPYNGRLNRGVSVFDVPRVFTPGTTSVSYGPSVGQRKGSRPLCLLTSRLFCNRSLQTACFGNGEQVLTP